MSSPYPILDNRPIDQWKVTELKEELKRRKLTTRGLKDDLIKRLSEALRVERENAAKAQEMENAAKAQERDNAAKDEDNGFNFNSPAAVVAKPVPVVVETIKDNVKADDVKVQVDINDGAAALGQVDATGVAMVGKASVAHTTIIETSITDAATTVSEVTVSGEDLQKSGFQIQEDPITLDVNEEWKARCKNEDPKHQLEIENQKPQLENDSVKAQLDPKPQLENEDLKPRLVNEDSKLQAVNEGVKPLQENQMPDSSASNNQVSEVNPNLGFQVKSDSISTDSVSINEKIELKDNIIADDVKLEIDTVKPEMVPSSSNVVPVSDESHSLDVEESVEKKAYTDERGDNNATEADMFKKIDSVDIGYSEKLNLDRSSGDDSMEEDVTENKQVDSKSINDELEGKSGKSEVPILKEESPVDVVGDGLSTEKKDVSVEHKSWQAVPAEKRKFHDEEAARSNEPLKRRKWNNENVKVPELQGSNLTSTTPWDATQPASLKGNFARSDSTASEDAAKERVVPPSPKTPTTALRIDRFLRPFTLKAVQELLGKTGRVTSFWMDHIKTHCYVTYSSVEEAVETRNAVYNLQWPPNGGRLLVAEFVDPQEVKMRVEAPPQTPTTPGSSKSTAPPAQSNSQPQPSPRQQVSRQQVPPPSALPPPPPLSNPTPARERLNILPPPPEKLDPPIVTLDDLFRKTKATPRIYYLPLSEEQVAAKLAARDRNTKQ